MRRDAREAAFKVVFSRLFHTSDDGKFRAAVYKKANLTDEEAAFAERLVSAVEAHGEELNAIIAERVPRYADYRIYTADRAIMLVALAEIKYFDDIPSAVSANEAADLARKYSTERSADFVSGVLGGVIGS